MREFYELVLWVGVGIECVVILVAGAVTVAGVVGYWKSNRVYRVKSSEWAKEYRDDRGEEPH